MITMARAKANILPHRGATRLVTWGPFGVSRNPIYLGNTVMTASAALAFGKLWLLPAAIAAGFATHHLAILREEAHLAANFGDDWRAYLGRTSRWLGWSRSQSQ
jgi:protein-S-isoprenylcysteine O-methyltransferase Ste14